MFVHTPNRQEGADYQEYGSGILMNSDGSTTEYRYPYINPKSSGRDYVDLDGHVLRGDPPVVFAQEFKDRYKFLADSSDFRMPIQLDQFVEQARRQLAAMGESGSPARLEWHFSDKGAADAVYADFQQRGISIDVYYSPWLGASTN
jgi:hypothetical protein